MIAGQGRHGGGVTNRYSRSFNFDIDSLRFRESIYLVSSTFSLLKEPRFNGHLNKLSPSEIGMLIHLFLISARRCFPQAEGARVDAAKSMSKLKNSTNQGLGASPQLRISGMGHTLGTTESYTHGVMVLDVHVRLTFTLCSHLHC